MQLIFIAMKNRYLNLSAVIQPAISNNNSPSISSYHVHHQADFGNPFINGEALSSWAFRRRVSLLFTRVQSSASIKTPRKTGI